MVAEFVQVAEAACDDEHDDEEQAVVGGVDYGAGGYGVVADADPGEATADDPEDADGVPCPTELGGVHGGEEAAGEDAAEDHAAF